MTTTTLPARETPRDVVPVPPVVVRHDPDAVRPFVAGTYVTGHRWSPLLAFLNPLEAVLYAAAVNRRTGRWS